jgi:hypothetical protein
MEATEPAGAADPDVAGGSLNDLPAISNRERDPRAGAAAALRQVDLAQAAAGA